MINKSSILIFCTLFSLSALCMMVSLQSYATSNSYRTQTIERVISASYCIVIAHKDRVFQHIRSVSILPPNSQYIGKNVPPYYEPPYRDRSPGPHLDKNYPPYQQKLFAFTVTQILFCRDSEIKQDQQMLVLAGAARKNLQLHTLYYLHGKRKHAISHKYTPHHLPTPEDTELIVFMKKTYDEQSKIQWEITMRGAFESIQGREAISQYLKDCGTRRRSKNNCLVKWGTSKEAGKKPSKKQTTIKKKPSKEPNR